MRVCLWVISAGLFSTQVRKLASLEEASLRKREIAGLYCSNFGFRSLCLSVVLVAVIIKICCDLRPTNSFWCLLFQRIFTARIVPHLTEPLAHFSHSHSISSLVSSFSLLQNYDFLVHAHIVLDFFFSFVYLFLKDHHGDLHDSRAPTSSVKFQLLNSIFKSLQIIIKNHSDFLCCFVLSLLLVCVFVSSYLCFSSSLSKVRVYWKEKLVDGEE